MNFPKVNIQPCIPTAPPPPDNRCSDPTYALLNPDQCAASSFLRIKPEVLLVCALGSVQFQAFTVANGMETPVTSDVVWTSSDQSVAVIGVNSGNATGLAAGQVTITATVGGQTATATLTVLAALQNNTGQGPPLIPVMTSDTTPSGVSSAGNSFGGVDTSWKAFDNDPSSFWGDNGTPTWLQYKFPLPTVADTLDLFGDFGPWTLSGSNDGTTFHTLATGPSALSSTKQTATFTNSTAYQYYRITFSFSSAVISMQLSKSGAGVTCCDSTTVGTVLVVDKSHSMSLGFGSGYSTKQAFADYVAAIYAQQTNANKDQIGLIEFDSSPTTDSVLTSNTTQVSTNALGIVNSTNLTSLGKALQAASSLLSGTLANNRVIVLISDGEDKDATVDPQSVATAFKNTGGVILCVGVRAHGTGFTLLNLISSGGFFVNAYPQNVQAAIQSVFSLKGYLCAGNSGQCESGNKILPTPEPHFGNFSNWTVGTTPAAACAAVNPGLFGPGYLDLLPGNGLYVSLTPCTPPFSTKATFGFVPGKTYRLSFDLAGNNQQEAGTQQMIVQIGTGTQFKQIILIPDYKQPFTRQQFAFTVTVAETSPIVFQASGGTNNAVGPLIDNIQLDDVTDLSTMFVDGFDTENLQFVPPACGGGLKVEPDVPVVTNAGITPISNPEAPTTFETDAHISLGPSDLTSDTTPAGVASASTETPNLAYLAFDGNLATGWISQGSCAGGSCWIQYQFPSALVAHGYDCTAFSSFSCPADAVTFGSNNGSTWTTITPNNTTAYLYYRIQFGYTFSFQCGIAALSFVSFGDMASGESYTYAISYQTATGETALSSNAVQAITLASNHSVQLILPGSVPASVTAVRVWRQETVGLNTRFYLLATLSPSATNYMDSLNHSGFQAIFNPAIIPPVANNTGTGGTGHMNSGDVFTYAIAYQTPAGETSLSNSVTHTVGVGAKSLRIDFPWTPPTVTAIELWRQETVGNSAPRFYLMNVTQVGQGFFYIDQDSHAEFIAGLSASPEPPTPIPADSGYGYTWYYGYNCYGYGCLNNPPSAQLNDPNPLPDIEANYVAPVTYSSTKSATVTCPPGTSQVGPLSSVPVMTSSTSPLGVVSDSSETSGHEGWRAFGTGPDWLPSALGSSYLQYKFTALTQIVAFAITPAAAIVGQVSRFKLQGSDDGLAWTDLTTFQTFKFISAARQQFTLPAPDLYQYFRLVIATSADNGNTFTAQTGVALLELLALGNGTGITKSATATSQISQADADAQAYAAALAAAQAALAVAGCLTVYSATASFTAKCPAGEYDGTNGNGFTASATYQSLISQADADTQALALATTAAQAGLFCNGSNNNQAISIPPGSTATPYPSVQYIADETPISRIIVNIDGFAYDNAGDITMLLVSPTGKGACLMKNCAKTNPVTASTFTFDSNALLASLIPFVHVSGPIPNTGWHPTAYDGAGVYEANPTVTPTLPAPQIAYPSDFAAMIGDNPKGSWSLWIFTAAGVHPVGTIASGWSLTLT